MPAQRIALGIGHAPKWSAVSATHRYQTLTWKEIKGSSAHIALLPLRVSELRFRSAPHSELRFSAYLLIIESYGMRV